MSTITRYDLRDRINNLDLPASAKRFILGLLLSNPTIATGWATKNSSINRKRPLGFTQEQALSAVNLLVETGVVHQSNNGKSITLLESEDIRIAFPPAADCAYCKKRIGGGTMTRDHVIPTSRGGLDVPENIVLCCRECNQFKADKTPQEVAKMFLDYRKPRKPMTRLPLRYQIRLAIASLAGLLSMFGGR